MKARAMVQVADRRLEMQEIDVSRLGPGEALMRVEACGLCGSDIEQYRGTFSGKRADSYPLIPGHEPVGTIEEIDAEAALSWGIRVGDRVALIPHLTCGRCELCLAGQSHLCKGLLPVPKPVYGMIPLAYRHGLWGGYSEYMHLHPRTLFCKLPDSLPAQMATMYQALASGLRWAVQVPSTAMSDSVLVLGCGQRGLASVWALRRAGVSTIIVTGLARDRAKLDLTRRLGASHTIVVDEENTVLQVMAITHGRGVDVAIDVVPGSTQPVIDAVETVRVGGMIVVAGIKGAANMTALSTDRLLYKEITLKGVYTQGADAYREAVELMAEDLATLAPLHTHEVALERVEEAILRLAGELPGDPICMSVHPRGVKMTA
ncbi:MAG: zinc-binding dehydrogenase [Burkholderiales bacterium]